jgi:hypothetical protein
VSLALILVLVAFRDQIAGVFNRMRGVLSTVDANQATT